MPHPTTHSIWKSNTIRAAHTVRAGAPARDAMLAQLGHALVEMHEQGSGNATMSELLDGFVERLRHLRESADTVLDPCRRTALPGWRLQRVERHIDEHLAGRITLNDMAGAAGLSPMHFAAQFRISTGHSPHQYLLHKRMEAAKRLMTEPNRSLLDIALDVGFQTQSHFTSVFKRLTGKTPGQWRNDAADEPEAALA